MNFSFGPPVAFTGQPNPAADALAAEVRAAHDDRVKLEGDLKDARAQLAAACGQVTLAQVAKETAEKKEAIARGLFESTRTPTMENRDYEAAAELQQKYDALESNLKDTRDELADVNRKLAHAYANVAHGDGTAAKLQTEKKAIEAALAATKQELEDQKTTTTESDSHLSKAREDLEKARRVSDGLTKAKNDAEILAAEREHEITGLHEQVQQMQETIDVFNEKSADIDELMTKHDQLEAELDDLRTESSDRDRTILIKDARIAHLETQFQKALEGKLNAELAASASAEQTNAPPPVFTSGDASLQDELDAASDYSDNASTFHQLDFSDIIEIADVAPVAPTLTFGTIHTVSTAPVAQQTATSSTQTDTSDSNGAATQTDPPEHRYGIAYSVAADISPVEPAKPSNSVTSTQTDDVVILAERKSQTAAAQTVISNPPLRRTPTYTTFSLRPIFAPYENANVATQTAPTVEKVPEPTIVHVVAPAQNKARFASRLLAVIMALVLTSLYLFVQLQAYKNANGYGYGSRNRYSTGAFGHGRYLFGIIPVGFDIGHDWFSEQVCRTTSTAVATFEDWIGITPTPLY